MTPTIMPTGGLCVSLQPPLRTDQYELNATICRNSPRAGLRDSRIAQQCHKEEPSVLERRSIEGCVYNSVGPVDEDNYKVRWLGTNVDGGYRPLQRFKPSSRSLSPWSPPSNIAAPAPLPSSAALAHQCIAYRGGAQRNTPLAPTQLTAGPHFLPATSSQSACPQRCSKPH